MRFTPVKAISLVNDKRRLMLDRKARVRQAGLNSAGLVLSVVIHRNLELETGFAVATHDRNRISIDMEVGMHLRRSCTITSATHDGGITCRVKISSM